MTTPTPRSDAALCRYTGGECVTFPAGIAYVVPYRFAQELERDLAAAQEARQRAEALAERYETRLFKLGAMDDAPCFKCGYNGAGYYQPHIHDCAAKHHAAREGK